MASSHRKAINLIKRGENLQGVVFHDKLEGAYPYYGEVTHGEKIYTSKKFMDEGFVEQWIESMFAQLIGGKK